MKNSIPIVVITANSTWATYNFRKDLIISFVGRGCRVVVVSPDDSYVQEIIRLGAEYRSISVDRKGYNPIKDFFLMREMYNIYKELSPCIIFHYTIKPNIYGTIAAKLLGLRSVSVVSGLGYAFINNNILSKIARLLYKISMRYAFSVWFLNRDDRRLFVELGIVDQNNTKIIPGEGIDVAYYSILSSLDDESIYCFTLIGRMLWDKGVGEYVEAARIIKNKYGAQVRFSLVGPIDDNPKSIELSTIAEWNDEGIVDYLGAVRDVRRVIASSRCIVLPSYREGMPRVLLEASSMAKPVIATRVPGCEEIVVHSVTGFLCESGNVSDLVDVMETIIGMDRRELKRMGDAGRRKVVNEYSNKRVAFEYMSFFDGVINDC